MVKMWFVDLVTLYHCGTWLTTAKSWSKGRMASFGAAMRRVYCLKTVTTRHGGGHFLSPLCLAAAARGDSAVQPDSVGPPNPLQTPPQTPSATEAPVTFDSLYNTLSGKLKQGNRIKAVELNNVFHQCQSLEQLEQAKELLATFRKSTSFSRSSQPITVIRTCERLGVIEEALTMTLDPVKYGLFPQRNASVALLIALERKKHVQGIEKVIRLMKHLDIRFTGLEYYFLTKALFLTLMNKHYPRTPIPSPEGSEGPSTSPGGMEGPSTSPGDMEGPEENQVKEADAGDKPETEEAGKEDLSQDAKVSLEDLKPTLDACRECYGVSAEYGNKTLYLINGVLLKVPGGVQVASEMLDQLETEGWEVPHNVILNMRLDNRLVAEDLPGVLALLQDSQARSIPVSRRKLPKLQEIFEKSENESLRQSFLDLKLT